MKPLILLLATLLFLPATLSAAVDVRDFSSELEERRYRSLVAELRCPKCQNTNLAGSDAGLADDLKDRVHSLLRQGASDDEIRQHMIDRYGDFVSYKPPMRPATWLLWWGPLVLLVIGLAVMLLRRQPAQKRAKPLDPEEKKRLQELLSGQDRTEQK
ncbi:MAG: cytochrome c-type biogenesis protein CcmH [Moraxellaceae bacterium]|nr:cytochrome c-type biogenesis protein CcmH [Moraxellaceae bacterium]